MWTFTVHVLYGIENPNLNYVMCEELSAYHAQIHTKILFPAKENWY